MRKHNFCAIAGAALIVTAASLATAGPAAAATVVLKDGTIIHGEIQSLQDDVYTVESPSLGTVHVRKQQVRTIDESDASPPTSSPPSSSPADVPGLGSSSGQSALEVTRQQIIADPGLFSLVLSLQTDPDVQAILADPDIMKAITSGDYDALMHDPKIIALTQNPKVREIIDSVQ
jgi:hypothetical protein